MATYAHGGIRSGQRRANARTMAQEAAQLANPSVNFAPFDNDGNGFVDAFIVIQLEAVRSNQAASTNMVAQVGAP